MSKYLRGEEESEVVRVVNEYFKHVTVRNMSWWICEEYAGECGERGDEGRAQRNGRTINGERKGGRGR